MHAMCYARGLRSIFELLNAEKQRILNEYFELQKATNYNIEPDHEWKFERLDRSMIKTNDPFIHNLIVWKLGVTYNRVKDATLNVNINMVINPFADKKAKIYFKKTDYFLAGNLNGG